MRGGCASLSLTNSLYSLYVGSLLFFQIRNSLMSTIPMRVFLSISLLLYEHFKCWNRETNTTCSKWYASDERACQWNCPFCFRLQLQFYPCNSIAPQCKFPWISTHTHRVCLSLILALFCLTKNGPRLQLCPVPFWRLRRSLSLSLSLLDPS